METPQLNAVLRKRQTCFNLGNNMSYKISDFNGINDIIKYLISTRVISSPKMFYSILNDTSAHYTDIFLKKKYSNNVRHITAPDSQLKSIHYKIKFLIESQLSYKKYKFKNTSQAYQKDKSIFTNAQIHRNKKYVLHLDISNFFDEITFKRINGLLQHNSNFMLNYNVSTIITKLCCYNGHLTQGSPVSPIISNLLGERIDALLIKVAKKYHFTYTRYADDLVFSTNDTYIINERLKLFVDSVVQVINNQGFSINWNKLSLAGPDVRHTVTGLTNNKKVSTPLEFYKQTRAMANHFYVYDEFYINQQNYNEYSEINLNKAPMRVIEGRLAHIYNIENQNRKLYSNHLSGFEYRAITPIDYKRHVLPPIINKETHEVINYFSGKELEYSKFIFYKFFIYGDFITVFTEGKTDPLYIKKAKSLLQINDFDLKIYDAQSEIDKKSMFSRLFNLQTGGKNLKKIFEIYIGCSDEQNFINYSKYFERKTLAIKPTILLYDFELDTKNRPLKNFIKILCEKKYKQYGFNREDIIHQLKTNGFYRIYENLYIAVTIDFNMIDLYTQEEDIHRSIEDYFTDQLLSNTNGLNTEHFEGVSTPNQNSVAINKDQFSKKIQTYTDKQIFTKFNNLFYVFLNIQKDYLTFLLLRLKRFNINIPVEKRMVINCLYRILNSMKTIQLIGKFELTELFMDIYNDTFL